MRKFSAVLLALPLGELSPQVTERAQDGKDRRSLYCIYSHIFSVIA